MFSGGAESPLPALIQNVIMDELLNRSPTWYKFGHRAFREDYDPPDVKVFSREVPFQWMIRRALTKALSVVFSKLQELGHCYTRYHSFTLPPATTENQCRKDIQGVLDDPANLLDGFQNAGETAVAVWEKVKGVVPARRLASLCMDISLPLRQGSNYEGAGAKAGAAILELTEILHVLGRIPRLDQYEASSVQPQSPAMCEKDREPLLQQSFDGPTEQVGTQLPVKKVKFKEPLVQSSDGSTEQSSDGSTEQSSDRPTEQSSDGSTE